MPGPGGGARGGGGGRGGSFGGGGFGGGRPGGMPHGGGFHRPPPRPYGFGWHRRRYYGGGCLGGLFNMLFGWIIAIFVLGVFLVTYIGSAITAVQQGGIVQYDENKFQDYADACYAAEFGGSTSYEDHILITVLVDPEGLTDYYYIAWVGDHIATDISNMMGGNETALGRAMMNAINERSYKYSLDSNLAAVMETMTKQVQALGLGSSFKCSENHDAVSSHLTNKSSLSLTAATVDAALSEFTQATGISVVIVVDEMEAVFGRTMPISYIAPLVIIAIVLVFVVVAAVKAAKRRNSGEQSSDRYRSGRRNDFD